MADVQDYVDIIFDGFPGPDGCCFVEINDSKGRSISLGSWLHIPNEGFWRLRIPFDGKAVLPRWQDLPGITVFGLTLQQLHEAVIFAETHGWTVPHG